MASNIKVYFQLILFSYISAYRGVICCCRTLQQKQMRGANFKPSDEVAMLLHRLGHDCSFSAWSMYCSMSNGKVMYALEKVEKN